MKISTKGRYALRMMVDLAEHQNGEYISLKDIAQRQEVSKKYLEQIVPILNKSGFLKTNRGYQGGYMLSKPPRQYTVGDILRLTEGDLAPVPCAAQDPADCPRSEDCVTLPVFRSFPHGPVQVKLLTGRGVLHIVHRVLHREPVERRVHCVHGALT